MSVQLVTRWCCDVCGAAVEGDVPPHGWTHASDDTVLCDECGRDDAARIELLIAQLAERDVEIERWKTLWRSLRADIDRVNEENRRLKSTRRRAAT